MPVPRLLVKAVVVGVLFSGFLFFLVGWERPALRMGLKLLNDGSDDCSDTSCFLSREEERVMMAPKSDAQPGGLLLNTTVPQPSRPIRPNDKEDKANAPSTTTSLRFPNLNKPFPFIRTPNHKATDPNSPFSYVFYALTAECLCGALINIHILRDTFSSPHNITLLHYTDIVTAYIPLFEKYDVNAIRVRRPSGSLQQEINFLKIHAAGLTQFTRVIVLDRGHLVFKPLDELFSISLYSDKP